MSAGQQNARVVVDGKFFRVGNKKFFPKGVTYGPFAPDANGETFGSPEQVAKDFAQIRDLNANVVRVYYVPPRWVLDLAAERRLKILVDIPWEKHRCFLETSEMREAGRESVREAASACAGHAALFAFSVANEIPAEIVRWHGARAVAEFIDQLVAEVKGIDAAALCTFASFPPTEFLQPRAPDFATFNVYLHQRGNFGSYLARLQTLAGEKPLVLGEFGADSFRETEPLRCEMLRWQIEAAFRNGLAGTVLFSFTDDWFRGGQQITDWSFGITTSERTPKPSFAVVQSAYEVAPYFPLSRTPKVSVVVASYNGAATLHTCLESLARLNYPNYEVILVDDGSTDATPQIAGEFPSVRTIRQNNLGLSAARNTGIAAATGEVVAFTDSDCRADEDWLYYLVNDLVRSEFAGIGGHNLLPPEDSVVAAAVLVCPGGPAHVMLTDREAEHIPGCNMAFYKWALDEIKGFDPVYRQAGDDVDLCWRLQELGYKIGFAPSAFVWHYRRSTVKAYLKQQAGYGEAEALLQQKHPEYFNVIGSGTWRGRIYAAGIPGIVLQRAVIYHGVFGSGFFQKLYVREPSFALMIFTSLQFHLLITLPLFIAASWWINFLPVALLTLGLSLGICGTAGMQAALPANRTRAWSRPLVALMFFLQPLVRGWARYKRRLLVARPKTSPRHIEILSAQFTNPICFWSRGAERYGLIDAVQRELAQSGWEHRIDSGWDSFDVEIATNRWSTAQLTTVHEELAGGRRFFRCRIDTHPSWTSRLLITIVALASSFAVVLFRDALPYVWFAFAVIPMALLFVATEERAQSEAIASLVAVVARQLGLELWKGERGHHGPQAPSPCEWLVDL